MSKYLEKQFPNVKDAFDGHIHMHKWIDEKTGEEFIHGFEEYRRACNLKYIALAPLPSGNPIPVSRDISNNIICAFYKMLNENTFSYGGFAYPEYPATQENMKNMSLETQYDELMEIGFDGIKMLEGKPNLYIKVNNPLDSDFFDGVFEKIEKDGTYLLMHVADPENFWTHPTPEMIERKWYYGDGTYPSYKELYRQIDSILEKHPSLNLCLAHFFFCSERPEKLEEMMAKYPKLCFDITPGGEMYLGFNKRPEYYKEFFTKYQDRIIFGTDMDFPASIEAGTWLCDRVYRYMATDHTIMSFEDTLLTGLNLPQEIAQKIFSDNLLGKLGKTPKPINKQALKRYIEKYDHLIVDRRLSEKIAELSKKYLD